MGSADDVTVRRITADDYDVVGDIHRRAFGLPAGPGREYVGNLCYSEPDGCLLAFVGAEPVGYGCAHRAGSVGYLGPSGVLKEHRGRGIGKLLVEARARHLSSRCRIVGLATLPDKGGNIGRDLRCGFRETLPCREMVKAVRDDGVRDGNASANRHSIVRGDELSAAERERVPPLVREWTDRLLGGLDLTRDLELFLSRYPERVWFCVDGGRPVAFIAQHDSFRGDTWFGVEPSGDDHQRLRQLLGAWEREHAGREVSLHFHTHCERLTELLLARGYRVQRDLSCMLLRDREGEFIDRTRTLFARPWWS
jgi:GNAT superfamily N-acetyltransferase